MEELKDELLRQTWGERRDATQHIQDIALKQGKRAVVLKKGGTMSKLACSSPTTCNWKVNLIKSRRKTGSYWYVSSANLNHTNCTGVLKPTKRQVVNSETVRAAVLADQGISGGALGHQLQQQESLTCSKDMLWRAKEQILKETTTNDPLSVQLLPSFLSNMALLNPGILTEFQKNEKGEMVRAMIALSPKFSDASQEIYGVDAGHMKHRLYNGVQLLLVGRDGNFFNFIFAVALVPLESEKNYLWFFQKLLNHGFKLREYPIFCDRHKGIIASSVQLGLKTMFCTRNIIGKMRDAKTIKLRIDQEGIIWRIQKSQTREEYENALIRLREVNTSAAEYIESIDPAHWALYPHVSNTPLYGWRTTNFVESEQSRSLQLRPRKCLPFEFFETHVLLMASTISMRHGLIAKWLEENRQVTVRAENKMKNEMKFIHLYTVIPSSPVILNVFNKVEKIRRVDLSEKTCTCSTFMQFHIPCRHILASLLHLQRMGEAFEFFSECYKVSTYQETFNNAKVLLPLYTELQRDTSVKPSLIVKQAGRPRKRRIRSRGENRQRVFYTYSNCKTRGTHNRRSCTALPLNNVSE